MSRLKRFFLLVHQRSLWQALAVYVGASFGVIGVVDIFIEYFGLPRWLMWVAFVLLVTGLPVVIVISLAKQEVYGDEVPAEHAEEAAAENRRLRFLTWRTAAFAFVGVLAVWGLVAAGWVLLGGTSYLLFRGAAAGFVQPEDCVVVAEFENETDRAALGATVRDQVAADLSRSGYVTVLGLSQVRETLGLMRLPDTTYVDERLALEIARRKNCPVALSGSVAPLGTGYSLTAVITETSSGAEVVRPGETAADETEVIGTVERLARQTRRHLGESLSSIARSAPLARVTTGSLEALELFTRGWRAQIVEGDYPGAVPFYEQAVALDTAFGEAYRRLWAVHWTLGNHAAMYQYADLAYRHRDRLTLRERLQISGSYHWVRGRLDSAAHYYRMDAELAGTRRSVGKTNLSLVYMHMGRFEDAFQLQLESFEPPTSWAAADNVPYSAQPLHLHALADSAVAVMREKNPEAPEYLVHAQRNAYYAGHLLQADSLAREMASDSRALPAVFGRLALAGSASMHGRTNDALALAHSAAQRALEAIELEARELWPLPLPQSLKLTEYVSLGAGVPERALPYLDNLRSQVALELPPPEEHRWLGQIANGYALAGDIQSVREVLAAMDSLAAIDDFRPTGIGEQVLAVIALREGRAEDAVAHLRRARTAEFGLHRWEVRWLLADAHAALGNFDEAIAQYDTLTGTYRLQLLDIYVSYALRPLAHERLGSLYFEVGDTVAAARHLAEFIKLWKDADPELQPRVEAARRLLGQLVAEPSR